MVRLGGLEPPSKSLGASPPAAVYCIRVSPVVQVRHRIPSHGGEHLVLESAAPLEAGLRLRHLLEEVAHQGAHGGVELSRARAAAYLRDRASTEIRPAPTGRPHPPWGG